MNKWKRKNKFKKIIKSLIELVELQCKFINEEQMRKYVGDYYFFKEHRTIKIYLSRQCGKTYAIIDYINENTDSIILFRNYNSQKRFEILIKNKNQIWDINDLTVFPNKEIVFVDTASFIKPEKIDDLLHTCSKIKNCICVLVG